MNSIPDAVLLKIFDYYTPAIWDAPNKTWFQILRKQHECCLTKYLEIPAIARYIEMPRLNITCTQTLFKVDLTIRQIAISLNIQHLGPLPLIAEEVQKIRDANLLKMARALPYIIPQTLTEAANVRIWMEAHQTELREVKRVTLPNRELTELPPEIRFFSGATYLCLSHNYLQELPPEIGHLTQLDRLDADYNTLKKIPAEIGNLSKLTRFYANNNKIRTLPEAFCSLQALQKVNLSYNPLLFEPIFLT